MGRGTGTPPACPRLLALRRVNVGCGPAEQRLLLTGLHSVADIFCESCKTTLGWKYVSWPAPPAPLNPKSWAIWGWGGVSQAALPPGAGLREQPEVQGGEVHHRDVAHGEGERLGLMARRGHPTAPRCQGGSAVPPPHNSAPSRCPVVGAPCRGITGPITSMGGGAAGSFFRGIKAFFFIGRCQVSPPSTAAPPSLSPGPPGGHLARAQRSPGVCWW